MTALSALPTRWTNGLAQIGSSSTAPNWPGGESVGVYLLRHDLRDAGFGEAGVHTIAVYSRATNASIPAIAYRQGTPLRNELEEREPGSLEKVTSAAAADIERAYGTGPISGKIQGHIFIASK